jgi:hypothetical protein
MKSIRWKPTEKSHEHLDYGITNLTQLERVETELKWRNGEGLKIDGRTVITRISQEKQDEPHGGANRRRRCGRRKKRNLI